jgi:hypothetical protein
MRHTHQPGSPQFSLHATPSLQLRADDNDATCGDGRQSRLSSFTAAAGTTYAIVLRNFLCRCSRCPVDLADCNSGYFLGGPDINPSCSEINPSRITLTQQQV